VAVTRHLSDISNVANPKKKAAAEARAKAIYARLMRLKQPAMSNNDWTKKAGVSTSFFTNMQGIKKAASEPSIGNLRLVLEAAGSSLPEFFIAEAKGRVVPTPTRPALIEAFREALPQLPRSADTRAEYLAEVVERILVLPSDLIAMPANEDDPEEAARGEVSPPGAPTK